ncbi:MAG TPA: D-alanyl-D-alanine carboxypeptidase family protein [Solirubrobacteraceae bacterium]|jgi:D-alanyl-D-alanine carboxypeptidase|nr:D-alanyl-D-alanine carboxypeptidase family protein [Solirubrobacteraceae bacterium]
MTTSPFMTPDQSRRRRDLARQRRRRRRAIGWGSFALAVAVAVVVVVALSRSGGHSPAVASTAKAKTTTQVKPVVRPTLSAVGLPLAKPALALAGIGVEQQDSVHIAFHHPPRAGVLFNLTTGQVLWQRNAFVHLRIASLTKMMTALLTVKSEPPTGRVLITKAAVNSAGSKVGVLPLGKHVRLETMLYGLLLPSGNDAAIALAQHVAGSIRSFVSRMNAEAAKLGMGCTRYSSPSGYVDSDNYSCAADLAVLAHEDLLQPRLAKIVRSYTAQLPLPIKGGKVYLYNNNPLLIYHYPGVTGLKTGFTDAAGRCLVATAERNGVRLGVVVLHSPDPGTQARQLLDRAFQGVYHQAPVREPPMPAGA